MWQVGTREQKYGHLTDILSHDCSARREKTLPTPTQSGRAHAAEKNHKCPPGHKQTDRRSRWPSPMICPNRLRVLAVSGSQIPRANMSGDWSTFNLNDLHAAAAAAASHRGNSDASITLHSLLKLNPRGIKEPNQLGAAAKKQKSPPPSLPPSPTAISSSLSLPLSVCSPPQKKTKGA